MSAFANIAIGGIFHAAVLFLVAAGLQLVFGVQKIVNLACGSFYALGAYFGITAVTYAQQAGVPPVFLLPVLIVVFLLQTLIVPTLLMWGLWRIALGLLTGGGDRSDVASGRVPAPLSSQRPD